MVKRKLKEKEIMEHLRSEGFKEVGSKEKKAAWYKKASDKPECLSKRRKSSLTDV